MAPLGDTCMLGVDIPRNRIFAGVQIDSCHRANVQYRKDNETVHVFKTDEQFNHGWAHFFFQIVSNPNNSMTFSLTHSNLGGGQQTVSLTLDGYTAYNDPDFDLWLGSLFGQGWFIEGRMFDVRIHSRDTAFNSMSSGGAPAIGACHHGEYYSSYYDTCEKCHHSCDRGCEGSGSCYGDHHCHPTCGTCTGSSSPGKGDECTSCHCNAHLEGGHCVCDEGFIYDDGFCKRKCHEGCKACSGDGEHECLACDDFYEMQVGCYGTCTWCDENECDEDGFPSCKDKGYPISECDCTSGQWFDGEFCRSCADGCASCDEFGNCLQCEAGLFRWAGYDGCWDFCPYGYEAFGDECTARSASYQIYTFNFQPPEDGCQIWEYRDNTATGALNYIVRVYGGTEEGKGEIEEPFIFADRGAWFDGKYDLMTFELVKLPETLVHGFWTKIHSDGVLFSAHKTHGDFKEYNYVSEADWDAREDGGYYLGVNQNRLEYVSR